MDKTEFLLATAGTAVLSLENLHPPLPSKVAAIETLIYRDSSSCANRPPSSPMHADVRRGTPNCQIYFSFVLEDMLSFSILSMFHTLRSQPLTVRVNGSFQAPTQMGTSSQTALETYFFPFM